MKFRNALPAIVAGSLIATAPCGMAQVRIGLSASLSGGQAAVGQDHQVVTQQLAVALSDHADAYHGKCTAK